MNLGWAYLWLGTAKRIVHHLGNSPRVVRRVSTHSCRTVFGAARCRRTSVAPSLSIAAILVACSGCWLDHFHRQPGLEPVENPPTLGSSYQESVGSSAR